MPFSGKWHRVGLVRTDFLEERVASILSEDKNQSKGKRQ